MKWKSIEKGEYPEILQDIVFWHPGNNSVNVGKVMPDGVHVNNHLYPCSHWMSLPEPPIETNQEDK